MKPRQSDPDGDYEPTPPADSIGKILFLAVVAAIAVALAIPLVAKQEWVWVGAARSSSRSSIFAVYLQPWHVPIKYLLPGTIFLIAFQVVPVVATLATSFTNFGDAHRGGKQDAITAIQTNSVGQVAGSAEYVLTIATPGDAATGDLVFLLYDPKTKTVQKGDATGLTPVTDAKVSATGKVTAAPGLTVLNLGQAANRSKEVQGLSVPTADGAIKASGVSKAFEGKATADLRLDLRLHHGFRRRERSTPPMKGADSSSTRRPAKRCRRAGW